MSIEEEEEITTLTADQLSCFCFFSGSRQVHPSLINKSSIMTVSYAHGMRTTIPKLSPHTQKLDLSSNLLRDLPLQLFNLKDLTLNRNYIQKIPPQINDLSSLRILKINNNKLTTIPYLKTVEHLEASYNPIKMLTTELPNMKLQFLSFDWIPFLFEHRIQLGSKEQVNKLAEYVAYANDDGAFVAFHQMFDVGKQVKILVEYLYEAIIKRYDFFIDYLKEYHNQVNYNALVVSGKPLLELVLDEDYCKAMELFTLRRANVNDSAILYSNLELACKFSRSDFFNYLTSYSINRLSSPHLSELIDILISHFSLLSGSDQILRKILKISPYSSRSKKLYSIPSVYTVREAENIGEALIFILTHPQIREVFCFDDENQEKELRQPLLHFSVASKNPQLIELVLQVKKNPFERDLRGKCAKMIRGSAICRKILWKFEKKCLKEKQNLSPFSFFTKFQSTNKSIDLIFSDNDDEVLQEKWKSKGQLISEKIKRLDKYSTRKFQNKRKKQIVKKEHLKRLGKQIDKTGILMDFMINLYPVTSLTKQEKQARKQMFYQLYPKESNTLSAYEMFQNEQLFNISHHYGKKKEEGRGKFSFSFCDDVFTQGHESEDEAQFIVLRTPYDHIRN